MVTLLEVSHLSYIFYNVNVAPGACDQKIGHQHRIPSSKHLSYAVCCVARRVRNVALAFRREQKPAKRRQCGMTENLAQQVMHSTKEDLFVSSERCPASTSGPKTNKAFSSHQRVKLLGKSTEIANIFAVTQHPLSMTHGTNPSATRHGHSSPDHSTLVTMSPAQTQILMVR